ncbi:MAG: serine hydrolase [Cyclobacteriaceae bacterium]
MKFLFWGIVLICAGLVFLRLSENKAEAADYFQPKASLKTDTVESLQPIVVEKKVFIATNQDLFIKESLKEFESFIKAALANKQAAGAAVAIVKDSSIIFLKGFGLRESTKPDSVNERTVFRIG